MTDTILTLTGSLRRMSFNSQLLREAERITPDATFDHYTDSGVLPHFNEDVELPLPKVVAELAERVAGADAILIATPEYNGSLPGSLKNVIDWLSRVNPPVLARKPVAVIGASMGPLGTIKAQLALRQILQKLDCVVVAQPEFCLGAAHESFVGDGLLPADHPSLPILAAVIDGLRRTASKERAAAFA